MPTYSYACTECSNRFDVVQAFTDDALTTCDQCSGRLRKVFGSVGVVFKGSGFYRTDNREAAKARTNGSNGHSKPDTSTGSGDKSGSAEKTTSADSSKSSSNGESSASSKATAPASTPS
ncbi:MAG TPA: FmdB family zinc ribbon protein [Mycobacterium sp.]|nr:FmdB family zinc ribbon protein [Mycobacterium sp.]